MSDLEVTPLLLTRLEPGVWQSGQRLSELLGVSRTSIWKSVQSLKRQGYPLEAGARGYRLEPDAPVNLPLVTYLGSVGSTMDEAKRLARAGAPEATVLLAEQQSAGRGRRGRHWQSPPGSGLYFTVVLRPKLALSKLSLLPLLVGAVLQQSLKLETGFAAQLKWSNDLLAPDGRKLAGVLLEAEIEDGEARFVLIGVGINVRQQNFPSELNAAALEEFVDAVNRRRLLERILSQLHAQYQHFIKTPDLALSLWRAANATLGRNVRVLEPNGSSWEGKALEVNPDGALLVETADGIRTIFAADVSLRHLETAQETS